MWKHINNGHLVLVVSLKFVAFDICALLASKVNTGRIGIEYYAGQSKHSNGEVSEGGYVYCPAQNPHAVLLYGAGSQLREVGPADCRPLARNCNYNIGK